ncbi:MAG TPA: PspA/IM30 family protein [Actinomycetota bacterium]|nr:PspA/IM30 family protein [Actinomycetota bacterium]
MGIGRRISTIFRAKASKALDRAEDPRETLDYSYERQQELLQKVRRGLSDVATSRKRVELQAQQLRASGEKLESQARQALTQGREDLAREAVARRTAILDQLTELKAQHDQLKAEEEKLSEASRRLQAKVDAFRIKKETIKATYTAAEASTRINEAVTGISEEMGDVGLAMRRAEDRTEQMRARAGALDEMISSGALEDLTGPSDPIQAQLDSYNRTTGVELELERLKQEIGYEQAPAIESKSATEGSK